MPGVSIQVKGTSVGTASNVKGEFSLKTEVGKTLVVSFIGYVKQEIPVTSTSRLEVVLQEETKKIDEVVVVGYGAQKKVNMTGAVSAVKFEEAAGSRPITNVSSALSGLSSGVTVIQSSGRPGSDDATIRVRGLGTLNNNNPLVIVDGMEGSLSAVNPQDIASISILKDAASASIYGSRAANGVVLVTTKKGENKRIAVTYNGIFSVAKPTNLLDFVSDYPTYMNLINEAARNIGVAEIFTQGTIQKWVDANKNPNGLNENGVPNYVAFPNTNWNKEIYGSNLVQNHNVSVNGGTQNARFLLSAGYLDNPGLVSYTGSKTYSLRTNVEADINKWLTVGTRTYGSLSDNELGSYSDVLTYAAASTPGVYPIYKGKYGYPEAPEESPTANNVFRFLNKNIGDSKTTRLNATVYSKVKFTNDLSWDFNFNYNKRFDEYNKHDNPQSTEQVKFSTGDVITSPIPSNLLNTYYSTNSEYQYTLENLLHYNKTFAENHHVGALLGYNETYYFNYNYNAQKQGLVDESVSMLSQATQMISIDGGATDWALRSYFGRLNYDFKQRYLFEANIRHDASSRFHQDTRNGVFPSFSAGWRISEESFLKDISWLQNLKLRASWGQLGNCASGNYDYQSLYSTNGYSFNGTQVTGLYKSKIENPDLRWESTTVTNVGLDFSGLNSRLSAEFDCYNKVTDGILTVPPIPLTLGLIGAPTKNTATVTNRGFEATLGWKDKIGDVSYSITGNFGYNKNEVTKYKGKLTEEWRTDASGNPMYYTNIGDVSDGGSTRVLEGHMINEFYLMDLYKGTGSYFNADGAVNIKGGPKDGMIRTPDDMKWLNAMISAGYTFMPNKTVAKGKIYYGDYIYADKNGDGIYGNTYDKKFVGYSNMPKFVFGSQMNFSWKNIDLGLIWSGQAGVKLYWNEAGYNRSNFRYGYQIGGLLENNHYYYNEADPADPKNNITADYPRLKLNEADGQNTQASTRWLYDGSFIRLKNLTVGYTLPKNITDKINIQHVRLYFSAENLLTITSFPGLDPEIGGNTNYPLVKQIAFGVNVTF